MVRKSLSDHQRWVRARGRMFRNIAVRRDYRNDYVLLRNSKVTAFLDWSDPNHPLFDPQRETGEDHLLKQIPLDKRAHVLVIPNVPREHIAESLAGQITENDLGVAQEVMAEARQVAKRLGIANPQIWINSENLISVGYLHVHIVGSREKPLPPRLESKIAKGDK